MKVNISQLGKGKKLYELKLDSTLLDLKQQIEKEEQIPVSQQKILLGGRILSDNSKLLTSFGVKDQNTLILMNTSKPVLGTISQGGTSGIVSTVPITEKDKKKKKKKKEKSSSSENDNKEQPINKEEKKIETIPKVLEEEKKKSKDNEVPLKQEKETEPHRHKEKSHTEPIPPPEEEITENDIQIIMEMGFTKAQVKQALNLSKNNKIIAVNYLLIGLPDENPALSRQTVPIDIPKKPSKVSTAKPEKDNDSISSGSDVPDSSDDEKLKKAKTVSPEIKVDQAENASKGFVDPRNILRDRVQPFSNGDGSSKVTPTDKKEDDINTKSTKPKPKDESEADAKKSSKEKTKKDEIESSDPPDSSSDEDIPPKPENSKSTISVNNLYPPVNIPKPIVSSHHTKEQKKPKDKKPKSKSSSSSFSSGSDMDIKPPGPESKTGGEKQFGGMPITAFIERIMDPEQRSIIVSQMRSQDPTTANWIESNPGGFINYLTNYATPTTAIQLNPDQGEKIQRLRNSGYTDAFAYEALQVCDWNEEMAMDYLKRENPAPHPGANYGEYPGSGMARPGGFARPPTKYEDDSSDSIGSSSDSDIDTEIKEKKNEKAKPKEKEKNPGKKEKKEKKVEDSSDSSEDLEPTAEPGKSASKTETEGREQDPRVTTSILPQSEQSRPKGFAPVRPSGLNRPEN